jgi:predicted O-methyltransferase YrrM
MSVKTKPFKRGVVFLMATITVNALDLYKDILQETEELDSRSSCDAKTGALLKTLVASKPGGKFLELGTGSGISTSWIINGMDSNSSLITVESDELLQYVAKKFLGQDERVTFYHENSADFIINLEEKFDLIFVDTWLGVYNLLEETLEHLNCGGFYVIKDLLPQLIWSEDHIIKASNLIDALKNRKDLALVELDNWSTRLIVAVKVSE